MIRKILIIPALILICLIQANAQLTRREVTLYNPYKPSLPDSKKRSFLPDMNDTLKVKPDFRYDITAEPFMPDYTISPIKAAALFPDPLTKLYKSYLNIGMGNYITPLAEISITNERSKKGTFGFYGRHFSTNGKIKLQNGNKVFAGYMDNDASLFGRKFFRKNLFESSVDFSQKVRYAYGYDPAITNYFPKKKDIRLPYNNLGAKASLSSLTLDSTSFSYDFDIYYNFFYTEKTLFQHNAGITGIMAKEYKGFYVGSGIGYDYFRLSDSILTTPKYIASISPFIKKSTGQWSFKLGLQTLLDKDENINASPMIHVYPDINLDFSIVPTYISFFAGLSGKLENNEALKIISENPYLIRNDTLFKLPNTDHELVVSAGLKGNTRLQGSYLLSASYSLINDMIFYSNIIFPLSPTGPEHGNYFIPMPDNVELFKIHGEIGGVITDKISYNGNVNWYKYTLTNLDYAYNKPAWDGQFGVKYNLRDKIIAGAELTAVGKRRQVIDDVNAFGLSAFSDFEMPLHVNLNLNAEYRYSKDPVILD